MFKDKNAIPTGMIDTLIGAGTEIEGHLISKAGIRVEGTFSGEIQAEGDIVVGERGIARCNISARDVTIAGQVHGDVRTWGKLIITPTGQLNGNLEAAVLSVQEGGIVNGISIMERQETKHAAPTGENVKAAVTPAAEREEKAKQAG